MFATSFYALLRNWKRVAKYSAFAVVLFVLCAGMTYSHFFGPALKDYTAPIPFTITEEVSAPALAAMLREQGYIKSTWAVRIALLEKAHGRSVHPGEYAIGPGMDTWAIANIFMQRPAVAFVTFPPSIRKEQMGDILAAALNWSDAEKVEWNTVATAPDPAFTEGVYYPDTYLIPADQTPEQIAARMRGRFADEFAPYAEEAQAQGMKWTDVLTLASIIDREAGKNDKPLVAGILLNRLEIGMRLQADATLQYAKGKEGNWWPQPKSEDKYIESEFNTYQNEGLPPHPINNPTFASIQAVLDPDETNCLFYLHDASHQIHCSITYAGQKENVDTYLR